jgi:hypothetical protein
MYEMYGNKSYNRSPASIEITDLFHRPLNRCGNEDFIVARQSLTPPASLHVTGQLIPCHKFLPNTSTQQYPLLIYHSCFPSSASASSIEEHLKEVGVVVPQWRYTMYNTTHFRNTTHEVRCLSPGLARLCMVKYIYIFIATDGKSQASVVKKFQIDLRRMLKKGTS